MITINATSISKLYNKADDSELSTIYGEINFESQDDEKRMPISCLFFEDSELTTPIEVIGESGFTGEAQWMGLSLGTTPETYAPQNQATANSKYKTYIDSMGYSSIIS